jgi:hypothetical protein
MIALLLKWLWMQLSTRSPVWKKQCRYPDPPDGQFLSDRRTDKHPKAKRGLKKHVLIVERAGQENFSEPT